MNFNLSGHIIKMESEVKAYNKCIVKDNFSAVMILIPAELLKDITLNDEVEIWGQLKGFDYNGKIYNNLFAKSLIKVDNKYVLLKKRAIDGQASSQFEILKYSPAPFSTEEINKHFIEHEKGKDSGVQMEENTLKTIFMNNKQSALYFNAYSTSIEKSLQDGSVCKVGNMISLNEGSHFFSKIIQKTRFIFFNKGYEMELTVIPNNILFR